MCRLAIFRQKFTRSDQINIRSRLGFPYDAAHRMNNPSKHTKMTNGPIQDICFLKLEASPYLLDFTPKLWNPCKNCCILKFAIVTSFCSHTLSQFKVTFLINQPNKSVLFFCALNFSYQKETTTIKKRILVLARKRCREGFHSNFYKKCLKFFEFKFWRKLRYANFHECKLKQFDCRSFIKSPRSSRVDWGFDLTLC